MWYYKETFYKRKKELTQNFLAILKDKKVKLWVEYLGVKVWQGTQKHSF